MSEGVFPAGLGRRIRRLTAVPGPNPEFLAALRRMFLPESEGGFLPESFRMGRTLPRPGEFGGRAGGTRHPRGVSRRTIVWIGAVPATAVLLLELSPEIAAAFQRLVGFIPGLGMVKGGATVRVLEAPVTLMREDIRLTVDQMAVDDARSIVIYHYVVDDPENTLPDKAVCDVRPPYLLLPDGAAMSVRRGYHLDSKECGEPCVRYGLEFDGLPADVTDATLVLPNLAGLPAAEDSPEWRVPLHLVPAPEGTVLPVLDVAATETNAPSVTASAAETPVPTAVHGIRISMEKAVYLDGGIILSGLMTWSAQEYPAYAVFPNEDSIRIRDGEGRELPYEPVYEPGDLSAAQECATLWTVKIGRREVVGPVTIR
jgi:hypothetical protein